VLPQVGHDSCPDWPFARKRLSSVRDTLRFSAVHVLLQLNKLQMVGFRHGQCHIYIVNETMCKSSGLFHPSVETNHWARSLCVSPLIIHNVKSSFEKALVGTVRSCNQRFARRDQICALGGSFCSASGLHRSFRPKVQRSQFPQSVSLQPRLWTSTHFTPDLPPC
jgi:hypothetical protein